MNGHAKITYDAIYEIDRASFTNEADFLKVVTALQDIEDTKVGQELFRDLQKPVHLQEGRRIKIECNVDDPPSLRELRLSRKLRPAGFCSIPACCGRTA